MTVDQRRFAREEFVALEAVLFQDVSVSSCTLVDISTGGAFVYGVARPRVGARVQLHGQVRGESFVVDAVVRWTGRSATHNLDGFGVAWEEIPHALATALAA